MIKIYRKKPIKLFTKNNPNFIDTTDLYCISLVVSGEKIPEQLLKKYKSEKDKVLGFVDESGKEIEIGDTDTVLLLRKPYFICILFVGLSMKCLCNK